jgi:tRNA-uridine aminocarboxypropyltransferase
MTLDAGDRPRGFRQPRCPGCGLSHGLCVCPLWSPLLACVDISIVMTASEARSASNSARVLALWLPRARLHVCGAHDGLADPTSLIERPGSALLFPSFRAARGLPLEAPVPHSGATAQRPSRGAGGDKALTGQTLTVASAGGTITEPVAGGVRHLIVPDGTWSQARRIERRWFAAAALPRIELHGAWPSVYGLRRGRPGLCTFEATALALGLLGEVALAQTLLDRFAEWARRAGQLKLGGPILGAAQQQHALHPAAPRLVQVVAKRADADAGAMFAAGLASGQPATLAEPCGEPATDGEQHTEHKQPVRK